MNHFTDSTSYTRQSSRRSRTSVAGSQLTAMMRGAFDSASHFATPFSSPPRGGSTTTVVCAPIRIFRSERPTCHEKNFASAAFWLSAFRAAKATACLPDSTPVSLGGLQQSPSTPTPQ